jgi:hypothetical protein
MEVDFVRILPDGENSTSGTFRSRVQPLFNATDLNEELHTAFSDVDEKLQMFQSAGSGWIIDKIVSVCISTMNFNPIVGSSYIVTPPFIAGKHATLNIVNRNDENCFYYCILAHKHVFKNNRNRVSHYRPLLKDLDVSGIKTPVEISSIGKFENQNPDFGINVLYHCEDEEGGFRTLYGSKKHDRKYHVNMLLLSEVGVEGDDVKYHYILIVDLPRLFNSISKNTHRYHVCMFCLHRFFKQKTLDKHIPFCGKNSPCAIRLPIKKRGGKKGEKLYDDDTDDDEENGDYETLEEALEIDVNLSKDDLKHIQKGAAEYTDALDGEEEDGPEILKFANFQRTMLIPVVYYLDWECLMVADSSGQNNQNSSKHEPTGFACLRVSPYDQLKQEQIYTYTGPDCVQVFFDYIQKEKEFVNRILNIEVPMKPLTDEQKKKFMSTERCECCEKKHFTRYRHHDHLSGEYVACLCNTCNLALKFRRAGFNGNKKSKKDDECFLIPIIQQNSKKYDNHIILKHLKKCNHVGEITVTATSSEQFIAFEFDGLRFLDSMQFITGSLETLVANMKKNSPEKFLHTRKQFSDPRKFDLICRKGIYPYEDITDFDYFDRTELPPIENFYSKLSGEHITAEEYAHAQQVWSVFGCKNLP